MVILCNRTGEPAKAEFRIVENCVVLTTEAVSEVAPSSRLMALQGRHPITTECNWPAPPSATKRCLGRVLVFEDGLFWGIKEDLQ
jgi:hypothetical protein